MKARSTPQGPSAETIRAELAKLDGKGDHYSKTERKRLTAALERMGEPVAKAPTHTANIRAAAERRRQQLEAGAAGLGIKLAPEVVAFGDAFEAMAQPAPGERLTPADLETAEAALAQPAPSFPATAAADREIATLRKALAISDERLRIAQAERAHADGERDDAQRALAAAEARLALRADCHAGPGTTEPACGACTSCLLRTVEGAEARADAAQKSAAAWEVEAQDTRDKLIEAQRKAKALEEQSEALHDRTRQLQQDKDTLRAQLAEAGRAGGAGGAPARDRWYALAERIVAVIERVGGAS